MSSDPNRFYQDGYLDLSGYSLADATLGEEWDAAVTLSPQGSIFATSAFLAPLADDVSLIYCLKGTEKKACVVAASEDKGRKASLPPWLVYGGIIFLPHPPARNMAQNVSEEFRISSALVQELSVRFSSIELALHPRFGDLRPVLWHNYGQQGGFEISLRYTAMIELPEFGGAQSGSELEKSPLYLRANKSRRQELRYAIRDNVVTKEDLDLELFLVLYIDTFTRQGIDESEVDVSTLRNLLASLVKAGALRMYSSRSEAGDLLACAIFAIFRDEATYLFGATSRSDRNGAGGTKVIWDALHDLWARHIRTVDLEGVNSPKRGYFKLSFGAELIPYFRVRLDS
ncbi:MAG: GNAT family N-acetyltransferase [Alphaproteobacteria bacterium]